jgi:hypothetical protein
VRAFGESESLPASTEAKRPADEHVGWQMTAIAAKVLGAKGAYRFPAEDGFVYLLDLSVTFVQ